MGHKAQSASVCTVIGVRTDSACARVRRCLLSTRCSGPAASHAPPVPDSELRNEMQIPLLQTPTVVNGDAISELGYSLGTSADNYRSYFLEAAFVQNLVRLKEWGNRPPGNRLCIEP